MKFVFVNGSSCSGKSTVIERVMAERENVFHLSYDRLKWSFSKYTPQAQFQDVQALQLAALRAICEMKKYDIICDSGLYREWRETLFATARSYGFEVVGINIEAEYDVLAKRFDERVANAMANPEKKISNRSKERFKELYDTYQNEKNTEATVFRSDEQTPDEIAKQVLALF
jgi:predicted kinase